MADEFTGWVRGVLEVGLTDPEVRLVNRHNIIGFFKAQIDARRVDPRPDDLITDLLNAEIDGQRVVRYAQARVLKRTCVEFTRTVL